MDDCCQNKASELDALRDKQSRVLWIVLAVNAVMFAVEIGAGLLAGSVALQADSLDMLGDTLVYGFSLFALTRADHWKTRAAFLKGGIMGLFGLGVLGEAGYKLIAGDAPIPQLMGGTAVVALAANALCLFLLTRHRNDDLNMRSTWLCSRNDIIANTGVILAAGSVYLTTSKLPDIVISLVITALFLRSAWVVLQQASAESRAARVSLPPI
jgi:cation diffusion facilitator family transporter